MTAPDLPPHLLPDDGPDPEAEAVVAALAAIWGVPRWSITTDREAEWCMSKLRAAHEELTEVETLAAEYRQRIDDWAADRTRRARATRDWSSAHLCRWWQREVEANPKVLSRKLPSGKVASTAGRLEWQVVDEAAAIRALADEEDLDELVVTKLAGPQALAKALAADEAAGRAVTPGGTVVPGIVVVRKPRTYRATPLA